ncbi:hypothetical protein BT67DRAFT_388214 [Trichocladium antarcticum]|uniref:Uncharacterized protein n=1 Tax=Trichocladium antarcticum TaxID=1450529 RepID=A0AAN6UEB0_9PEZI|nr:hypothetical protein BT67DRAFT_388214 [Trichocladium antarcticum]
MRALWLLVAAHVGARAQTPAETESRTNLVPTAIRKMPPDQGAKFHPEYYAFAAPAVHAATPPTPLAAIAARRAHDADDARRLAANASAELSLRPPFVVLSDPEAEHSASKQRSSPPTAWDRFRRAASALALLDKRQWSCPSGTSSCAAIGYPNSCCSKDEACMAVPDTGLGPVGCCPSGATCGGGVASCGGGSTACGSDVGGGCCIPGFVCGGVGCKPPPPPSS